MRIDRRSTPPLFSHRRSRQRGGCLPFFMLLAVLSGLMFASRDRLADWLLTLPQAIPDHGRLTAALASGDLDSAVRLARQRLEVYPDDGLSLILLVRALIYRSYVDYDTEPDRRQALQLTTNAYNRPEMRAIIRGAHALALQANGRSREASQMALAAIQRDPDDMPARLALALSYANQGLFEVALREAGKAVEIAQRAAPDWQADAYRALAITHSDLGRYDNASTSIAQAISHNRRLIPLHFERALYALQVGDKNAATAAYFQVIAFEPENAKAHLRLCEISITLREREAALRYCNRATELAPGWSDAWYQLGREHFLQGSMADALKALNRCSTLQILQNVPVEERRFECWYWQGQAAEALGDCEALLSAYNQFQAMSTIVNLPQTWTYPPEGPAMCLTPPVN